jgi:UDP-glucose 4-epimerase
MNNVVVTGANGFLAQYVVSRFASRGWHVVGVDRTPPQPRQLQEMARFHRWPLPDPRWAALMREQQPDLCVHCAGSASVPLSFDDPATDYRGGPALVFELLETLRHASPRTRFLFLSSAAVYGHPARLPITEDDTPAPISPYGIHKWQAEQLCREFANFFGLATASLRIFSAYGRGLRRQVIWDICAKLLHAPAVTLQGTGAETRDFIHGQDVAQAIECVALQGELKGESYNVASGVETTIAEVGRRLTQLLAVQRQSRFSGTLPEGTPARWRADIRRLETLGFRPLISLSKGLGDFVAWIREEMTWQNISASA